MNYHGNGEFSGDTTTMARAYSDDLRRKFLGAYDRGVESLQQLSERFEVRLYRPFFHKQIRRHWRFQNAGGIGEKKNSSLGYGCNR